MGEWFTMLYEARVRLGLSQADLAARSHVSLPSVKSYEQGKRHPSRPYLTAMLDALRIDRSQRNAIMMSAGYATDSLELGPWLHDGFMFSRAEACEQIQSYPWPSFVANEFMEVYSANDAAMALWDVDIEAEFPDPLSRSVVNFASDPRFVERVVNIDEAFTIIASAFKGHPRGAESLDNPSPNFARVLERFRAGDPRYVAAFSAAWQRAEPVPPRVRWEYPLVWRDPEFGEMRVRGVVSVASEPDGLVFNDWIPIDAASWDVLQNVRAARKLAED